MSARNCVIFDLDGTLTQSEEGILNCTVYACEKMGWEIPTHEVQLSFIGPPLKYSFVHTLGKSEEEADQAIKYYRERYTTIGLYENRVYPGIRRLLRMLKRKGCWCAIATGKPQEPSERIVKKFRLDRFIDRVVGASDHSADKEQLIRAALPEEVASAVMVGDRLFDVEGGKCVGIRTIGVGYGYGSEEELRNAGCDEYAATVQDLIDILCPGEEAPRGYFLSMEGPDGSGKTTQLRALTDGLSRCGFELVPSREPGGCPISEKIRDLVLDPANKEMTPECEALLYAASRAQHVREVIRPAVAAGRLLLCDRFVDSSVAYQGGGRALGVEPVLNANDLALGGTLPDATVYLDIDHTTAMSRRRAATEPDRMELEADAFHGRVEDAYHAMIARQPERFIVVDATRTPEEIAAEVLDRVLDVLEEIENG